MLEGDVMKVSNTLLFMLRNPIPFIVHLTCWFLFAAWGVVADDPFIEGTWPYIVKIVEPPASIGDYLKAASIIWGEIVDDLTGNGFWVLVVMPPFLICYREAIGNLKGIAKERQVWMQWYDRQQEVVKGRDTLEEPPSVLEKTQVNSYVRKAQRTFLGLIRNPLLFIRHFTCWFSAFVLFYVVVFWSGVPEIVGNFVEIVPPAAIFSAILAFLTSYQEMRGTVKGIAKERQVWTKWYRHQINTTAQGDPLAARPLSLDVS